MAVLQAHCYELRPDMSDRDPTSDTRDCGGDVAAYALGALDPAEAETFRRHLETCTVCRDELSAFEAVVEVLPLSGPAHRAPPELRRQVMRAVAAEPRSAAEPSHHPAPRRRARWSLPRPVLAFGTALAVAIAAFVGVQLAGSGSSRPRIVEAQVTGQGAAQLRIAANHADLVVHHFSPPPAGQIYEVWLKHGDRSPSPTTALFSVNAAGEADVDVPGSLRGVSVVMVTPEPAGGSQTPTHPAVISATLS